MTHPNLPRVLASIIALSLGFAATSMAQEPLEHIPAEADVVLRLKSPQQTIEKAALLAEAIKPGSGDAVRQSASQLGPAIRLPDLTGVDQSRDWYVVVSAKPEGRPDIFFAIPTTDAAALQAALPERIVSRVEQDWVIYTGTADAIPEPAEAGSGISSVMSTESAEVFARGDLSLFINTVHLTEVYQQKIAAGRAQVDAFLEQAEKNAPQAGGMNLNAIMGMYRALIGNLFQAVGDARGVSVAVVFAEEGVQIETHLSVAEDSASARMLARHPTSEMEPLSMLPAGAAAYYAMHGDMQRFIDWGWSLNADMLAGSEEQKQKFEQARREWREIEFGHVVGAFQLGAAPGGFVRTMSLVEATPIEKVRSSMRNMSQVFGNIELPGLKQTMTVQPDAETIGSHSIDLLTVKQEIDPDVDRTGMQRRFQEAVFGPEGMVSRIAFLDGFYAQTMGDGSEAMQSLLAASRDPRPHLASFREGLSSKANLLVLIDLPALAIGGLRFAESVPNLPIPIDARALSQMTLEPSYLGYTVAAEDKALRMRVNVPAEQIRGIVSLVETFRAQVRQHPDP